MAAFLLIGIYLAAVIIIGVRGTRLASESDMFNIFGRAAGTIRASSGYLSLIGGGELITITQLGYGNGWSVLWFLGGIALGFIVLAYSSGRLKAVADERKINTLAGYYADQFGASAGLASTIIFVLSLGSLLTIQFIVGSDLLSSLIHLPRVVSILVIGLVILAYLIPAGIVAVLSTDVLRVVMMAAVLTVIVIATASYTRTGVVPTPVAFSPLPYPDNVIYLILGFLGAVAAADVWQTLFASAKYQVVKNSLVLGALAFMGFGALLAKLGMLTRATLPSLPDTVPAFVAAATHVVPGVLAPLLAVLVTGSVMSTADTEIWVIATLLLSNFRPSVAAAPSSPLYRIRSDKDLKHATRWVLPLVTTAAMATAYFSGDAQTIYTGLLSLLSASGVAILAALFLRPKGQAITLSLWSGLVVFIGLAGYYRFEIPVVQSLIPLFFALLGYGLGTFVPRRKQIA